MKNIVSECRSANIVRNHAMILPDDATPFSERTALQIEVPNSIQWLADELIE